MAACQLILISKKNLKKIKERLADIDKFEYIWIDTSSVFQIDIDNREYYEQNKSNFKKFAYFKSVTKKLPHYFVPMKSDAKLDKNVYSLKDDAGELLCGQGSWALIETFVYNPNCFEGSAITLEELNTFLKEPKKKTPASKASQLSKKLNNIMKTEGEWNFEDAGDYCRLCPKNNACLFDPTHIHSGHKCCIVIGKKHKNIKINCFKSGNADKPDQEKKIDCRSHKSLWKSVKQYFELVPETSTDDDEIKFKDLRWYVDEYCHDNCLKKHNGYMMCPSEDSPIVYKPLDKFSRFLDNLFRDHRYKEAYKGVSMKDNLIKYLENCHIDIDELEPNPNIIAFKNGYIELDSLKFIAYEENDTRENYDIVAKVYQILN